jgi:hypothetical protein
VPDELPEVLAKQIRMVPVDLLIPWPGNPRRGDVDVVRESIRQNGYFVPIIAQTSSSRIIAGHTRLEAAIAEGLPRVPVIWLDVDDATAMRMLLVENRANDVATNDDTALLTMLREIFETEQGLIGTGFTDDAMDVLVARVEGAEIAARREIGGGFAGEWQNSPEAGSPVPLREVVVLMTEEQRTIWIGLVNEARGDADTPVADLMIDALRALIASR